MGINYTLFSEWTGKEVYFVMRQKDDAKFRVVQERSVPMGN